MKILLCGASGFIGHNLFDRLNGSHEVLCPGRDLCDPDFVAEHIRDADVLIQAAAVTSGSRDILNTPWMHVTDNAVMNSYIMRAAHENGIKHVIFLSCSVMYPSMYVTEDSFIDPYPKYFGVAHTKLYVEKLCQFYASFGKTKYTVIRHSNTYGQHDKFGEDGHVCAMLIDKVMRADDGYIAIRGTGEERRDLVHVDDLTRFIETIMLHENKSFSLYNYGGGGTISINDLAQKIIALSGKDLKILHDLSCEGIPTNIHLDNSRAWAEFDCEPKVSLDEGLTRTMEWYKHEFLR